MKVRNIMNLEMIIDSIEFSCPDVQHYPGFNRVINFSDVIVDEDTIKFEVKVPLHLEDYMLTIIPDYENYEEDYLDVELIDGILTEKVTITVNEINEFTGEVDYDLEIEFLEADVESCTDTKYPLDAVNEAINRDIEDYDIEPSEEFEYEYYTVKFNLVKDIEN